MTERKGAIYDHFIFRDISNPNDESNEKVEGKCLYCEHVVLLKKPENRPSSLYYHIRKYHPEKSAKYKDMAEKLSLLSVDDNYSLEMIESPIFHKLMGTINSSYKLPTKQKFLDNILPSLLHSSHSYLQNEAENCLFSIKVDLGFFHKNFYLAFFGKTERQSWSFNVFPLNGRITGEVIRTKLMECLRKSKINEKSLVNISADCDQILVDAFSNYNHTPCLLNVVSLCIDDAFKEDNSKKKIQSFIDECDWLRMEIKDDEDGSMDMDKIIRSLSFSDIEIEDKNFTEWIPQYYETIYSFYQCRSELQKLYCDRIDLEFLLDVEMAFRPIFQFNKEIPNCHPMEIIKRISSLINSYDIMSIEHSTNKCINFINSLRNAIKERMNPIINNELFQMAMFLHPKYRSETIMKEIQLKNITKKLFEKYEESFKNSFEHSTTTSNFHTSQIENIPMSIEEEIDEYLKNNDGETNYLINNEKKYPRLNFLRKLIDVVSVTSIKCKNIFESSKNLQDDCIKDFTPDNISMFMYFALNQSHLYRQFLDEF
ncbi:hypothetical protein SNEBB_003677 [Seison nebaliae]|nr:hypothetical protein SNEBB_003677 [Seison nebaliae]